MTVSAISVRQARVRRRDGHHPIPTSVGVLQYVVFVVAGILGGFILTGAGFDLQAQSSNQVTLHPERRQIAVKTPAPIVTPVPTANPGEPKVP